MKKASLKEQLVTGLVIILLLPLILLCLIPAAVFTLVALFQKRKEYKRSCYYKSFEKKFSFGVLESPQYRFYTSAVNRKLPVEYVRQVSDGTEYFIYNGVVYIFPDFDFIDYDAEKKAWYTDDFSEWHGVEDAYRDIVCKLDEQHNMPIRLLLERQMLLPADLNGMEIPDFVFITWEYGQAFENEELPHKMRIPQSAKDLYEMMLQTPTLCGSFWLSDGDKSVVWSLYENAFIEISIQEGGDDSTLYLYVLQPNGKKRNITHWHPSLPQVYGEACKLGGRGNVLVARTFLLGDGVIYIGSKADCPYGENDKRLIGKQYYFEAK